MYIYIYIYTCMSMHMPSLCLCLRLCPCLCLRLRLCRRPYLSLSLSLCMCHTLMCLWVCLRTCMYACMHTCMVFLQVHSEGSKLRFPSPIFKYWDSWGRFTSAVVGTWTCLRAHVHVHAFVRPLLLRWSGLRAGAASSAPRLRLDWSSAPDAIGARSPTRAASACFRPCEHACVALRRLRARARLHGHALVVMPLSLYISLSISLYISLYLSISLSIYACMYVWIWERERERDATLGFCWCV